MDMDIHGKCRIRLYSNLVDAFWCVFSEYHQGSDDQLFLQWGCSLVV